MNIFTDEFGDIRIFWGLLLGIIAVAAVVFCILLGIRQIDYHYESTYCQPKLSQINRHGKFVKYNFWEYDCLVKTTNGTYIPIDNLYNNVQENNVQ